MKMTYCGSCKALHRMAAEKLERDAKHEKGSNLPEEKLGKWTNITLGFLETIAG